MSPGFSSQWNSSQPAWNTYTFPRASLHYQSHASYTYCAGHPAVSNYNLFCSYLNELYDSPGGGGAQGLTVQHISPVLFVSHNSQDSSCVLTVTLENIRMSLRHKQMWKFHGSVEIHIFLYIQESFSLHEMNVVCLGFSVRDVGWKAVLLMASFLFLVSLLDEWIILSISEILNCMDESVKEGISSSLDLLIFTTFSLMWSVVNMQSCC